MKPRGRQAHGLTASWQDGQRAADTPEGHCSLWSLLSREGRKQQIQRARLKRRLSSTDCHETRMMVQHPAMAPNSELRKSVTFRLLYILYRAFLQPHLQAFLYLQRATEQRLHACGLAATDARGGPAEHKHSCAHRGSPWVETMTFCRGHQPTGSAMLKLLVFSRNKA